MKLKLTAALAATLVFGACFHAAQNNGQKDAEHFILESERQWAESVASGDTSKVEQFLADDFKGVDTDGSFYDKAKAISDTHAGAKNFVFNHLNEAKVMFYGDAAVAQGSES